MKRATGQQPKPDQFGKVRRNIARLKTVLREKQAAGGNDK
jgi:large subunit ribosomal protein L29